MVGSILYHEACAFAQNRGIYNLFVVSPDPQVLVAGWQQVKCNRACAAREHRITLQVGYRHKIDAIERHASSAGRCCARWPASGLQRTRARAAAPLVRPGSAACGPTHADDPPRMAPECVRGPPGTRAAVCWQPRRRSHPRGRSTHGAPQPERAAAVARARRLAPRHARRRRRRGRGRAQRRQPLAARQAAVG